MKGNTRILVIDDEKVVCDSCRRILTGEGYDVTTSTDGMKGLDMASREDFDAVLLDLRMPRKSGLEVLRGIREQKPRTAVVMITAYPSADSAVESMRLGAKDYVLKPFTPDELRSKVHQAIEVAEAKQETGIGEPVSVPLPANILVAGAPEHAPALEAIARSEGSHVDIVDDVGEVVRKIRTGQPEMLILGLEMFVEASHDLIPAVRGIRDDFPIIVVSSEAPNELVEQARSEGVLFYLVEPFGEEELKAVMRGALRKTPFARAARDAWEVLAESFE